MIVCHFSSATYPKQIQSHHMKKFIRIIAVFLIVALPVTYTFASSIRDQLQQAVTHYCQQQNIPGLAVSITLPINNKMQHYFITYGTTQLNGKTPINPTNLFKVGSITKSFTSAILLQLEANPSNNFNINQTLGQWLPQYPQWSNITVKELLNMTSGIYDYTTSPSFLSEIISNPMKQWTPQALIAFATNKKLAFTPGHGWQYSSTNYLLAGLVIEAVSRHSISYEMSHMLRNLGLYTTYYLPKPYPSRIMANMVHGYNRDDIFPYNTDTTAFNMSWGGSAGAIVSSPEGINNWITDLLDYQNVLPPKQLKQMQSVVCTSVAPQYGCDYAGQPTTTNTVAQVYGLGISHVGHIWWHDGSTMGYSSIFMWYPPAKISAAIMGNRSSTKSMNNYFSLLDEIIHILSPNSRKVAEAID